MAANNNEKGKDLMDENEILIDHIIKYREGFEGFLQLVTGKFQDLVHQIGGLRPEFYEIYTRMIILNELCEKFISYMDNSNIDAA